MREQKGYCYTNKEYLAVSRVQGTRTRVRDRVAPIRQTHRFKATMRILIPTVDYPPIEGGISTVALQVSRVLACQGHEVTVVAPAFPDMDEFDAAEPVRVLRFPGYDTGWFRLLPFLRTAWPLVRDTDCILAINVAYGGLLGRLAYARHGTPYINFAYAYEFLKFARNPVVGTVLRSIYRKGKRCIAISRFTRENLIRFGVHEDRICIVLPGASPAEPVPRADVLRARHQLDLQDAPFILAVGRFIPRKGHIHLVEALPAIQERQVGKRRYREWRIQPKDEVFVFGYAMLGREEIQVRFDRLGAYTRLSSKYA
ncbi:MAG: glycosyltransferase, partial [Candidatus Hydrogenedentes bacterium]|nr:glycosyltransferase [Candidatus Hydrogenedentota bacterium]